MIQKLIIRPKREKGETTLMGQYYHGLKSETWSVIGDGKRFKSGELGEKETPFKRQVKAENPYVYIWDDRNEEENMVANFWKNHPQVEITGSDNNHVKGVPQFVLEIAEDVIKAKHDDILHRLEIANRVLIMGLEEKRNLMFALAHDPREMSHQEINIKLIGQDFEGLAMDYSAEFDRFFNANDKDQEILANANKAVKLNIITYSDNVYRIGGKILGATMSEVFLYLKGDKEQYENYIKPEVKKGLKYTGFAKDDVDVKDLPVQVEMVSLPDATEKIPQNLKETVGNSSRK